MQIEAIVQDAAAQGFISTIDALNIRLENQVSYFLTINGGCGSGLKKICINFVNLLVVR